jgi:hypothetical protein
MICCPKERNAFLVSHPYFDFFRELIRRYEQQPGCTLRRLAIECEMTRMDLLRLQKAERYYKAPPKHFRIIGVATTAALHANGTITPCDIVNLSRLHAAARLLYPYAGRDEKETSEMPAVLSPSTDPLPSSVYR